ncbi:sphingomyelin synthase-related protein 1 isoform X3 [Muntiacus reevesi]|uniref:sphingomyelin synthase-related protein 1 isoform X3 n=1 Tax=Muntiacus reevesi TaxID=9886 RepID=UPI0033070412
MPARSRHRPSLHSGSLTRAPPPPLKASLSREARRAPDSDSCSDADSEAGPGSPIRNRETVEEEMAGPNQLCIRRWTTKHVAVWLKDEGFFEYVDVLCNKHRLDGITLLTLTEYDLRSPPLEIKVLGDIKRLMLSVRKLQKIHIDVLEEMGYNSDSPMSPMTPLISALQSAEWLCNGEPSHDCDGPITDLNSDQYQYVNGKNKHSIRRLDPEYWKTILSCIYVFIVFGFTSFIMVIVHERVPDMQTYPPLPDIFLDSVPRIPWAFAMTEVCGMILCYIWLLVLLLHKHRSILLRRLCSLMGTVFLLRCFTMFVTSLSVPGQHLQCTGKKKQQNSKQTSTSALLTTPKPLTVWIITNWKILQEMEIPDHLTCLLRNLYADQEATIKTGHGIQTGSKSGKEYIKAVYCHPAYLTSMQSTSCEIPDWMKHRWNQDCWEKYQ